MDCGGRDTSQRAAMPGQRQTHAFYQLISYSYGFISYLLVSISFVSYSLGFYTIQLIFGFCHVLSKNRGFYLYLPQKQKLCICRGVGQAGIPQNSWKFIEIHGNPLEFIEIHINLLKSIWNPLESIGIHWNSLKSIKIY